MRFYARLAPVAVCSLLCSGQMFGQAWTTAVNLGKSSGAKPALAMNGAGKAVAAFGYTPAGGTGAIYSSFGSAGQPWTSATMMPGTNVYDATSPQASIDAAGATLVTFDALQIDTANSAYMAGWGYPNGAWTYWEVTYPVSRLAARVQFYGASQTYINNAVLLTQTGCGLYSWISYSGNYFGTEASVTPDCVVRNDFALDVSGNGVVGYLSKSGQLRAVHRWPNGTWDAPVTLATAVTSGAQVAVSASPAHGATLVYSTGTAGSNTVQVFAATLDATGQWGPPELLSSSACALGVGTAMTSAGDALATWADSRWGRCKVAAAIRPSTGGFAQPAAVGGARASFATATATAGGSFVIAWGDAALNGSFAAVGNKNGIAAPVKLGSYGAPALAAGGGFVSAAWCATYCFASNRALP
jgi:hypothetical protein